MVKWLHNGKKFYFHNSHSNLLAKSDTFCFHMMQKKLCEFRKRINAKTALDFKVKSNAAVMTGM